MAALFRKKTPAPTPTPVETKPIQPLGFKTILSLQATVEPEKTEHKITTRGVKTGEKLYKWEELSRFWFTDKWGQQILNIDTRLRFPSRLIMLLADQSQDKIKEILGKYLQQIGRAHVL